MKKPLKIILTITIILILLGIVLFGIWNWYVNNKLSKINYIDVGNIEINNEVEKPKEKYRNILLLGIDSRQDTYEGSRSDCMIIVTINEETKEVKLTSVYRDSYLDIPEYGLDKAGHAYAYGGPNRTINMLNRNLDLSISQVVVVNFAAMKDIINSIGGVEMQINQDEVKYIKGIDKAGTYKLNGDQALQYSRIRYTEGGDYKRTERMRNVLIKVFEIAKTKNVVEINELLEKLLPEISTNIPKKEIVDQIYIMASYKVTQSKGWPYENEGRFFKERWYGVPIDLSNNVSELHKELFDEQEYQPSQTVLDISEKIKREAK